MSQFFIDLGTVIREEIADFTQILAFILAIRFPRIPTIVVGVICSTIFTMLSAYLLKHNLIFIIDFHEIKKYAAMLLFMSAIIILNESYIARFFIEHRYKIIIYTVIVLAFILVELIDKTGEIIFELTLNNPFSTSLFFSVILGTLAANIPVIFFGNYCSSYLQRSINVIFVSVILSLLAFQIIMS